MKNYILPPGMTLWRVDGFAFEEQLKKDNVRGTKSNKGGKQSVTEIISMKIKCQNVALYT
jgi:hypothetical protein